ncbi:MAG TPA: site-specific integrase [Steroidobacteraceae bacterium]|jgi:integrase|nr:site-specific integrase [Steroidobacteraceae bacterium]
MMRTKDAIHQELAIEQARLAELERAREEARTKIELLRSELTAAQRTTSRSLPLSFGVQSKAPDSPADKVGDHLTPAVLLSLNTGLRRGEVLKLRWSSVDFNRRLLTVEGRNAKNRQTRHVPLNEEAMNVLRRWREQSGGSAKVFDVATRFQTAWKKLLLRAGITHFRWHDLRHHFASRLVQRGVPLNTVRDLLGHSSVGMSLRYAHLAPDQRREAVAKLNEKPILALTLRLPRNNFPATSFYPIEI